MTAPTEFTLEPFWLGYAVALAVCVGWAWRLSREAKVRDKATAEREPSFADSLVGFHPATPCPDCAAIRCQCIPREAMWRAIQRERGE